MHPNVELALASWPGAYRLHRHSEFPQPIHNPRDFARQLNYDLARITKALLVRSPAGAPYALAVAPASKRVNFATLARELGVNRVEIASLSELQSVTGYPPQGVSPLGVPGVKVFLESNLLRFETVLIGAGETGEEIEIAPRDLLSITAALALPLSV